jgi:hypothetical protein
MEWGALVTTKNAVLVLGAWMMVTACAIGTPHAVGESSLEPYPEQMGGAGGMGMPDPMLPPPQPDSGTAMFVGDACAQGTMEPCACDGSTAMGQRMCLANPASPTGGALSECRNCPAAMPDAGTAGEGGAGGASGMSGTGGTGGASGMSAGTGGMTGGTGGTGGGPACMCMDALACCRDDGTCGVGVPGLCF